MSACLTLIVVVAGGFVPAQGPLRIVSPVVHADRTVTFQYRNPNAKRVDLDLEGTGTMPMEKGADGVWSLTTKALRPDLYGYTISVDGAPTFDPLNPAIKPNLIYVGNLVSVPGSPPEPWEVQDVPHGELHQHFYKSGVIGDQRDYFVYTPAGYSGMKKLPVLVLLHGYSDTANGWPAVGKANVILDNLIAQGKAKPMVVVMPLGYGIPGFASPTRSFSDRNAGLTNVVKFREALMDEVLPQVEKAYHVSTLRKDRAIAGLSMGGAESLLTGLTRLDKFGYVGAFSAGGFPAAKPEDVLPKLDAAATKNLKLLWMACGTEDGLIGFQRGFAAWIRGKGISISTKETSGGHQWILWRRNLAEFAGLIFR